MRKELQSEFKKDILFGGVVFGIVLTLLTVLSSRLSMIYGGIIVTIVFVLMLVYFCRDFKKKILPRDEFKYGTAFLFVFLLMLIAGVISSFGTILINYIEGWDVVAARAYEKMEEMGLLSNLSPTQMEESLKNYTDPMKLFMSSMLGSTCSAIVMALIFAAIYKKRDDQVVMEFEEDSDINA